MGIPLSFMREDREVLFKVENQKCRSISSGAISPTEGTNNYKWLKVVASDMEGWADADSYFFFVPTYTVFYYPTPVLLL